LVLLGGGCAVSGVATNGSGTTGTSSGSASGSSSGTTGTSQGASSGRGTTSASTGAGSSSTGAKSGASSSGHGATASSTGSSSGGHGATGSSTESNGSSSTGSTAGSSSGTTGGTTTSSVTTTGGSTGGTTGASAPLPDGQLADGGYTLVFDDEFDTLSLMPTGDCNWGSTPPGLCDGGGTWLPEYTWGNRTLSGNDEAEIYVDPTYAGSGSGCNTPLGINPLILDAGILTLQANPTPTADLACLMNLPYTSGAIVSYPSFDATYGFFETRAKLPAGEGLWPAFWLLDENLQWPPEIDIFEFIGGQYTKLEMHTHDSNSAYAFGATTTVPDVSLAFHVYGLDWEPDTITWYFDGVQQAQTATAPDLDQPMYILLNLAVGGTGSWPGPTNASTPFPADMQIDYVRVWQKM
jgi:hypothetical protein